eukprot:Amastigsp_a1117_169.p3 type:complete len:198 gc:universal Amastigsp_a1117_169:862-1455(+)
MVEHLRVVRANALLDHRHFVERVPDLPPRVLERVLHLADRLIVHVELVLNVPREVLELAREVDERLREQRDLGVLAMEQTVQLCKPLLRARKHVFHNLELAARDVLCNACTRSANTTPQRRVGALDGLAARQMRRELVRPHDPAGARVWARLETERACLLVRRLVPVAQALLAAVRVRNPLLFVSRRAAHESELAEN